MEPVLDPPRFQELFDDFGDEAADVLAEFVAETDREVAELLALLGAEPVDATATQATAHKLKGGCLLIGARRLQAVATELDALGKAGAPGAELAAHAPALAETWAQTRAAIAPHLPASAS